MCPDRIGAALAVVLIVGTLALPLLSPAPEIAVGVWLLAIAAWTANRDAITLARRHAGAGSITFEWALPVLWLQFIFDGIVPQLGSAVVLFVCLASIAAIVRGNAFPSARMLR